MVPNLETSIKLMMLQQQELTLKKPMKFESRETNDIYIIIIIIIKISIV